MGDASAGITIDVDLRGEWSHVRDQGGRSACLACATSDAHTHCHSLDTPLSAEFLFYHSAKRMADRTGAGGLTFDAVDSALQSEGQPSEHEWPYQATQPSPWTSPAVTLRWYGGFGPATPLALTDIDASLRVGKPVVLGVKLTAIFMDYRGRTTPIPGPGLGFGAHAILAVGLGAHVTAGPVVLVRNSWGPTWGLGGHAWIEQSYFADKLIDYRTVSGQSSVPSP